MLHVVCFVPYFLPWRFMELISMIAHFMHSGGILSGAVLKNQAR